MKMDRNPKFPQRAVRTRDAERALATTARRLAPRVAAGTPVLTGATKLSTEVETGHKANDGRPAVRIVQTGHGTSSSPGAPVPSNFRHHRDYMIRSIASGA